jgi:hypothetical protein
MTDLSDYLTSPTLISIPNLSAFPNNKSLVTESHRGMLN